MSLNILFHDIGISNWNQRTDCRKEEESGKWNFTSEKIIAYCRHFHVLFMCIWLAAGEEQASLSSCSQSVCPACHSPQTQRWGDRRGASGPGGERLCISVINLLMPTLKQQEIADFSSFTLGQEYSTRWVAFRISWSWLIACGSTAASIRAWLPLLCFPEATYPGLNPVVFISCIQ